jgi:hypothetical protein
VDLTCRKGFREWRRAFVGGEIDVDAARAKYRRQRLGGKEMSARASGRNQDQRRWPNSSRPS